MIPVTFSLFVCLFLYFSFLCRYVIFFFLFCYYIFFAKILFYLFFLQSTLSKTDTSVGTGTKCPSWRDVRLIEGQIKGVKTLGVRLIEVSVKRESTILLLFIYCFVIKKNMFYFFHVPGCSVFRVLSTPSLKTVV